jgi:hypothetical protein
VKMRERERAVPLRSRKAAERCLRCAAARSCLPRKLSLPETFAQRNGTHGVGAATSVGMTDVYCSDVGWKHSAACPISGLNGKSRSWLNA